MFDAIDPELDAVAMELDAIRQGYFPFPKGFPLFDAIDSELDDSELDDSELDAVDMELDAIRREYAYRQNDADDAYCSLLGSDEEAALDAYAQVEMAARKMADARLAALRARFPGAKIPREIDRSW